MLCVHKREDPNDKYTLMKEGKARMLIIMPAHNEVANIHRCLESFTQQTRPPDALWVVDDNSTDDTSAKVLEFSKTHPWIHLIKRTSSPEHHPGAKVVEAFKAGLPEDWESFDLIGKFDADILLPPTYFEGMQREFQNDPRLGICSGHLYIEQEGDWVYEPIANPDHVRGPIKLYTLDCYKAMGGLRSFIGWDTADVLLARYHGFEVKTLPDLRVKHLRPTGKGYSTRNAQLQGLALYNLRYGWLLSFIAAAKMGLKRGEPMLPLHALSSYCKAFLRSKPRMLTRREGRFVREWRWKQIKHRLLKSF